ncbi:glycosyltransferase family 32 protein [Oceanisphaera avium]|uniref:Glycosyl transferase n=1 Tax=Oceanisphaera avium TaxID=1903694 RepID=A0A1Y0CZW4_9GAMM|nr:glycosyltransferase [Oceanisphaera avium]ART80335.1 glycosyl transferase [Oceanisphaera avium]
MNLLIIFNNRLCKFLGIFVKALSYPFHWLFPKKRFSIPSLSPAILKNNKEKLIPKIVWQTNFTNKVSLPVYTNYLYNRLMSLDWEYRYVSTEERLEFIQKYGTQRQALAFSRLTVGAAQADFWRVFVLNQLGGVYMDIDGHAVWPLSNIIKKDDQQLILSRKHDYTNYFIASAPNNPLLIAVLEKMVNNIENNNANNESVYGLTGPGVLNEVIGNKIVNSRNYKTTCIQGSFTNEHFQYLDKPRGKWTYVNSNDLLK